ncbi:MAG: hypothetical protein E7256_07265 [Lachnospiraceae bacterium]|nr:hypothetical protein [Lachnospiraceae bacterium]
MAVWNKVKQQLESFLAPSLTGRLEYRATSYRYAHDKSGKCCIAVDKKEVFSMCDMKYGIRWYQTVNDVKKDPDIQVTVSEEEISALREETQGKIPEERLYGIIRNRKISEVADHIIKAQVVLGKTDFADAANRFLSTSIEESLASNEILLNILAIVDRRVGKSRLRKMKEQMNGKHPIVQYFYALRCETEINVK